MNRRAHLNGREFIEAWKVNNPSEYRQMKQDWQKYLREIGKIPKTESPTTKTSQPTSGSRQAAQVTQVGKDVYSEAREEAMAQLEESSRRSNSWLGKFRRG